MKERKKITSAVYFLQISGSLLEFFHHCFVSALFSGPSLLETKFYRNILFPNLAKVMAMVLDVGMVTIFTTSGKPSHVRATASARNSRFKYCRISRASLTYDKPSFMND